jgi:hypothetical protein
MRKVDRKHIAFHVLVGLYLIWAVVFATLMGLAIANSLGANNGTLTELFTGYIVLNLIMGSALFVVIRLFRNTTLLNRVIFVSYLLLGIASIITVCILKVKE